MKLYKLTDKRYTTYEGSTKWGRGVTHAVKKRVDKPRLCSKEVIHAYRDPNLALLLNPIHANINPLVLWEAEGEVCVEDWGKTGGYELTTTRRLSLPEWYKKKTLRKYVQIQFAVLCAWCAVNDGPNRFPMPDVFRLGFEAAIGEKLGADEAIRIEAYAGKVALANDAGRFEEAWEWLERIEKDFLQNRENVVLVDE